MSDIQDYMEYIIKKHLTFSTNPLIHIYINIINNGLVFKIKNWYRLELQACETIKLFGSTKTLIDKTKNRKNIASLEVVEIVLLQYNLVDNQDQQKRQALYTFMPNKSYAYLLNVEPIHLVFLKSYITLSLMLLS